MTARPFFGETGKVKNWFVPERTTAFSLRAMTGVF
jgi:hypothetical protein